eukprot:773072-Prorocentrum_minimum.AAC.1
MVQSSSPARSDAKSVVRSSSPAGSDQICGTHPRHTWLPPTRIPAATRSEGGQIGAPPPPGCAPSSAPCCAPSAP